MYSPTRSSKPKVLITTTYVKNKHDFFDTFAVNTPYRPRLSYPSRSYSSALRFLKINVTDVEILEYPSWQSYIQKLREGWDIVGFSFYHYELDRILAMSEEARRHGIRELWAGGYGALSSQSEFSDRRWTGYCEDALAREVFGTRVERLRHPTLAGSLRLDLPPSFRISKLAGLYTSRGCPYRCTFCQAPLYAPTPARIPLESIEEVLNQYARHGVKQIGIHDETFGIFRSHSERVVEMMRSRGMRWSVASRVDMALKNLDYWADAGLSTLGFGIETLRGSSLAKIKKGLDTGLLPELARRARGRGVLTTAYYMIGCEDDTVDSIAEDLLELRNMGFDSHQLTINTPFPGTLQWDYIGSTFGLIDSNPAHYDTRHLVWKHPHIGPVQMRYLLTAGCAFLNRPLSSYIPGILRMLKSYPRITGDRSIC